MPIPSASTWERSKPSCGPRREGSPCLHGGTVGIQGGGDRSELRPLRPDGNIDHDLSGRTVVGNHKGQYAAYNIVDPRPGTVHQYGNPDDVLGALGRGWWVADPEVDGCPAYAIMDQYLSDNGLPAVRGAAFKGMVHLVTSEENFRRLMEEQQTANREALRGGQDFLERVSESEYATGRGEGGRYSPTRFATRDHGRFLMDGDNVREEIVPRGILREENI